MERVVKLFTKTQEDVRLKLAAILALTGVVFFNAITSLLAANDGDNVRLSDKYPNLLAASDSVSIIWIFIFIGLWAYVIYQFSTMRGKDSSISELSLNRISIFFILNTVLNVLWVLSLVLEVFWLSVVLIIAILYTLVRITGYISNDTLAARDTVFIRVPFSLYFGWVTYATVGNIMLWLVSMNWTTFTSHRGTWAVGLVIAAAGFALVMMYRHVDWIYGAAVLWAFLGILVDHLSPSGWNGTYPTMIVALTIVISVLVVATLYVGEKEYRQKS
ncbi:MAG: hypothetical protein ABIQ64_04200 [Candidatus Saccharimonadales bacterium]